MFIDEVISSSGFIKKWKDEMRITLLRIDPNLSEKKIEKTLNEMIHERLQVPSVTLDNNYTGESRDTNMLSVFDWALERKPIIAGNATFYKNQNEAINPIANMLDGFLTNRKKTKKLMFSIEDPESDRYKDLDRKQLNYKRNTNSYYGGSGMPKSAFYSVWSGPATTGTAQSIIATTETFFEGFLVDNYKFIDINECFHFMNEVLKQDYELPKWIVRVSEHDLFNRIKGMFFEDIYKDEYENMIYNYIYNLNIDEITKIYYKYNFMEFTRVHDRVLNLYDEIFSSVKNLPYANTDNEVPFEFAKSYSGDPNRLVKEYNNYVNKEYFMDPNSPPKSILEPLNKLNEYYMMYVYIPYLSIDRIYRLKYFLRKTVCIVDTDSNILALDSWINFCNKYILQSNYGRSKENNKFISINIFTYFITSAVGNTLDFYGINSNIPKEFRKRFNMKNEFYFDKLVIGRKKKRYISSIKLREGNLMKPYKADVKGFEFMKATTSEQAKKRFDYIVKTYILESEVPDVSSIIRELRNFENEIRESIVSGDKTYLTLGNAKDLAAYKNPYSQQCVRGAIAWNLLYPDNEISFPSKVSVLKLNIFSIEDMEDLQRTHPREYNIIKNQIFGSSIKEIREKGLQVISIPSNSDIPEWCLPYIDYNTVINNIISQFKGVLDVFGVSCPEVGKMRKSVNRKTKKFSNIVRF